MTTPTRMNIAEAAAHMGISPRYLYQLCRDRKIRHERIGGRTIIRFLLVDVEAYLASRTIEPVDALPVTHPPVTHRPAMARVSRAAAGGVDYFSPQGAPRTRRRDGGSGGG
jgi:excisionase family DNA binding protein